MQWKKLVWVTAVAGLAAALTSCNLGKAPEPTPDVGAIYTGAAQTMVAGLNAQQTQTAQAMPPTQAASPTALAVFSPLPTFAVGTGAAPFGTPFSFTTPFAVGSGTPVAGLSPVPTARPAGTGVYSYPVGCDDAMFTGEDPQDSPTNRIKLTSGEKFKKSWELQNVGTCKWGVGYSFHFLTGDNLHPQPDTVRIVSSSDTTNPGHSQSFIIWMWAPNAWGDYSASWRMFNAQGVPFGSIVSVNIHVGH